MNASRVKKRILLLVMLLIGSLLIFLITTGIVHTHQSNRPLFNPDTMITLKEVESDFVKNGFHSFQLYSEQQHYPFVTKGINNKTYILVGSDLQIFNLVIFKNSEEMKQVIDSYKKLYPGRNTKGHDVKTQGKGIDIQYAGNVMFIYKNPGSINPAIIDHVIGAIKSK